MKDIQALHKTVLTGARGPSSYAARKDAYAG